jgi:hypothetical protein
MVLLLLLRPLLHGLFCLLQLPLHFHDFFQARANRLACAVGQDLDVQVEGYAGVEPGHCAVRAEEGEAAVQVEPLLELEARHAGGEVGLALEAEEVGGADGRHCVCEGGLWYGFIRWVLWWRMKCKWR